MSTNSPKSKNIVWHHGKLTAEDRVRHLGQRGAVVWLTGLSGCGKSTVAREIEHALIENKINSYVLDGDNIRHGLNSNLGFSPDDRKENIRRIGEVARLFCETNIVTLTAFISPYRADRDLSRSLVPKGQFFEVFCNASLEVCEQRDTKGLYKKARAGQIPEFTGISAPYEAPENAELVLKSDQETVEESTRRVLDLLAKNNII